MSPSCSQANPIWPVRKRTQIGLFASAPELRHCRRQFAGRGWVLMALSSETEAQVRSLSPRQFECLLALAAPMSAKEAAAELGLALDTFETHVKEGRRRLGGLPRVVAARLVRDYAEAGGALPKRRGGPTTVMDSSPPSEPNAVVSAEEADGSGFVEQVYVSADSGPGKNWRRRCRPSTPSRIDGERSWRKWPSFARRPRASQRRPCCSRSWPWVIRWPTTVVWPRRSPQHSNACAAPGGHPRLRHRPRPGLWRPDGRYASVQRTVRSGLTLKLALFLARFRKHCPPFDREDATMARISSRCAP